MSITSPMMELIRKHEGWCLELYTCTAGKSTIGFGRNLDNIGITEDEAEYLLMGDVKRSEEDVLKVFDADLLYSISCNRYSVLVNMMFNLGLTRFSGFKNMIQAIKDGDFTAAAHEMLDSKWAKQVKQRAYELANMMERG